MDEKDELSVQLWKLYQRLDNQVRDGEYHLGEKRDVIRKAFDIVRELSSAKS